MGSRFTYLCLVVMWGMHGRRPPPSNMHPSAEAGTLGMVFCGFPSPHSFKVSVIGGCIPGVLFIVTFSQWLISGWLGMGSRFPNMCLDYLGDAWEVPTSIQRASWSERETPGMVLCRLLPPHRFQVSGTGVCIPGVAAVGGSSKPKRPAFLPLLPLPLC